MSGRLTAAVGEGARNNPADVRLVQAALNRRVEAMGLNNLGTSGVANPSLTRAIRRYQRFCLGLLRPDGRLTAGGHSEASLLDASGLARQIALAQAARARLTGAAWWHANQARFPNSSNVADLAPAFGEQARSFIAALRNAGATVRVNATRRNAKRAYLMHYSWQVSRGAVAPADVPSEPGVDIIWNHDDAAASREAAREMVALFQIAFKPSLTSNHIRGTAIDMTIDWTDAIDVVDGQGNTVRVNRPRSGATNTTLHDIGASYGVRKLLSDPPHWSANGR